MPRRINYGTEPMVLHDDGCISRPIIGLKPSGQWKLIGAVTRNNFGHVTHRYSLADVLADPGAIPWRFKNGAQRTFVLDLDHGTMREWRSPRHDIV